MMSVSFATLVSPTQVESVRAVDLRKSSLILNIYKVVNGFYQSSYYHKVKSIMK